MDKIKNLSLRKTIVLYMIISLLISFFVSTWIVELAGNIQDEIWWKYVDQDKYSELAKGDGVTYLKDVPRPQASQMQKWDHQISEFCDFLQTFTVLIVSVMGSIVTVFLFYKHKLKKPIAELELASKKISNHDLDFQITYENRDEMGNLCQEFERMRKQLAENNHQLWNMIEEEKALRAAIAHDIRSPLSVLEGYQEMLEDYLPQKGSDLDQAMEMMRESRKQIDRMDSFVETMRKMSSLEARQFLPEELTDQQLAAELQAELRILEKKFGKICHLTCMPTKERFWGDREVILEVIENLLSNAFRYAKTKVEIQITLTQSELLVCVTDDGVGFTADKEKITEPFYHKNMKDSLKHTGMGMYLSRLYCEKHGGKLLLGNGATGGAVITAVFHRIASK